MKLLFGVDSPAPGRKIKRLEFIGAEELEVLGEGVKWYGRLLGRRVARSLLIASGRVGGVGFLGKIHLAGEEEGGPKTRSLVMRERVSSSSEKT